MSVGLYRHRASGEEVEALQYDVTAPGELIRWSGNALPNRSLKLNGEFELDGQTVRNGDLVVFRSSGAFYPARPDLFEFIYEPV